MSTYASQQDLIDRFGEAELIQATDKTGSGAIDDDTVTRALTDADGEINGYLATRYTVPLTDPPAVVVAFACDIARYLIYDDAVPDQVANRYKRAVAFFQAMAAGKVTIGPDSSGDVPASSGAPQYSAPDRVFTKDTLSDY